MWMLKLIPHLSFYCSHFKFSVMIPLDGLPNKGTGFDQSYIFLFLAILFQLCFSLRICGNFAFVVASMVKDRAHLSTFKFFILEKFSCIVVLIVFFVIVQSSGLTSVWFREKITFFLNFISFHIFAIYVGGACWGLPAACRLIAVSGARLPSVDGLTVRYIKNAPLLNLPSKYVCDLFQTCYRYMYVWYKHTGTLPLCLQVALSFIWLD